MKNHIFGLLMGFTALNSCNQAPNGPSSETKETIQKSHVVQDAGQRYQNYFQAKGGSIGVILAAGIAEYRRTGFAQDGLMSISLTFDKPTQLLGGNIILRPADDQTRSQRQIDVTIRGALADMNRRCPLITSVSFQEFNGIIVPELAPPKTDLEGVEVTQPVKTPVLPPIPENCP